MNIHKLFQIAAVLALMAGVINSGAQSAAAADNDKFMLATKLQGKISGTAFFAQSGKQMWFDVSVRGAPPGSILVVTGRCGKFFGKIAWMRVGKNGEASVSLFSGRDQVPQMQSSDKVEVWIGSERAAWGTMKLHQGN